MSKEDVELLEDAYAAFARGDYEAAFARIAPEFTLSDHMIPDPPTDMRGPDTLRASVEGVREVFDELTYEPFDFLDLGDRILVRVRASSRTRHTGLDFRQDAVHLWTVHDGMRTRVEIYPSWDQGKAAAGLA